MAMKASFFVLLVLEMELLKFDLRLRSACISGKSLGSTRTMMVYVNSFPVAVIMVPKLIWSPTPSSANYDDPFFPYLLGAS